MEPILLDNNGNLDQITDNVNNIIYLPRGGKKRTYKIKNNVVCGIHKNPLSNNNVEYIKNALINKNSPIKAHSENLWLTLNQMTHILRKKKEVILNMIEISRKVIPINGYVFSKFDDDDEELYYPHGVLIYLLFALKPTKRTSLVYNNFIHILNSMSIKYCNKQELMYECDFNNALQ